MLDWKLVTSYDLEQFHYKIEGLHFVVYQLESDDTFNLTIIRKDEQPIFYERLETTNLEEAKQDAERVLLRYAEREAFRWNVVKSVLKGTTDGL